MVEPILNHLCKTAASSLMQILSDRQWTGVEGEGSVVAIDLFVGLQEVGRRW